MPATAAGGQELPHAMSLMSHSYLLLAATSRYGNTHPTITLTRTLLGPAGNVLDVVMRSMKLKPLILVALMLFSVSEPNALLQGYHHPGHTNCSWLDPGHGYPHRLFQHLLH